MASTPLQPFVPDPNDPRSPRVQFEERIAAMRRKAAADVRAAEAAMWARAAAEGHDVDALRAERARVAAAYAAAVVQADALGLTGRARDEQIARALGTTSG